jgi:colicin import membrane protein
VKLYRVIIFAIILIANSVHLTPAIGQNDAKNRAQSTLSGLSSSSGKDPQIATQRNEIVAARAAAQARFEANQPACYQKFAVNACLDSLRVERREALADLRRQEIELNNQERRQMAAQQTQTTETNLQQARDRDAQDASAKTASTNSPAQGIVLSTAPKASAGAKVRGGRPLAQQPVAGPHSADPNARSRVPKTRASTMANLAAREAQANQRATRSMAKQAELDAAQKAALEREQARRGSGQAPAKSLPLPP